MDFINHIGEWINMKPFSTLQTSGVLPKIYNVHPQLTNPNASDAAKRLMCFLTDVYGRYIISGQQCNAGACGTEIRTIEEFTGKKPAILELDLIDFSCSNKEHGSESKVIDHAIEWYHKYGGIVTFCWHWNAPSEYLINSTEHPWFKGFYKRAVTIDLDDIMEGRDNEGYSLLMRDIDAIARQFKILSAADVPVLWRPLHEASGGWFWWGNCKVHSYKKLWNIIYDKLTNQHKLNNLIWVWNGQNIDWYPGDNTVDIIGEDIYPGEKIYSLQTEKFTEALNYTKSRKIISMTENGCLFDPDLAVSQNTLWSWFCTWDCEFVINKLNQLSEQYTEKYMWNKVYNHKNVLTLDRLPDIKNYSGTCAAST